MIIIIIVVVMAFNESRERYLFPIIAITDFEHRIIQSPLSHRYHLLESFEISFTDGFVFRKSIETYGEWSKVVFSFTEFDYPVLFLVNISFYEDVYSVILLNSTAFQIDLLQKFELDISLYSFHSKEGRFLNVNEELVVSGNLNVWVR